MSTHPQVLVLDAANRASQWVELLGRRGLSATCLHPGGVFNQAAFGTASAVLCVLESSQRELDQLQGLLRALSESNVATLVWGEPSAARLIGGEGLMQSVGLDANADEVAGRLASLAQVAPMIRRMDAEIRDLTRLGKQLDRYFGEIDQEMRLAGRLQRDFMPRVVPHTPPLRFATLFRPASWVSGDIYDIIQLDAGHVALFIADAMGHGTAAALMTMFLRQSLKTRSGQGADVRLLTPAEAIAGFNECIARQKLPDCQFVTAAYGIVELDTLRFTVARGGHPYPLHVAADGTPRELAPVGGLLGIAELCADFEQQTVQLQPGEKIIFYTDGIEDLLISGREAHAARTVFTPTLLEWCKLDGNGFIDALRSHLDHQEGSLNPADDVTVLVAELPADADR